MSDVLDDYFRCEETADGWDFQVGLVRWPHPSTPATNWITIRRWKLKPDQARLSRSRTAVFADPRFFRTCSMCHELNNAGHMHDQDICQRCAQGKLGAVY